PEQEAQLLRDKIARSSMTEQEKAVVEQSIDRILKNTTADTTDPTAEIERKPPLSEPQKAELLQQANRLMESKLTGGLKEEDRQLGLTFMLYESANPSKANQ